MEIDTLKYVFSNDTVVGFGHQVQEVDNQYKDFKFITQKSGEWHGPQLRDVSFVSAGWNFMVLFVVMIVVVLNKFFAPGRYASMMAMIFQNGGNEKIILCERGIRTFETYTRNTLDLSAVPMMHELSHLPIIVDPSHATGVKSLVAPMAQAAVAAGCDGLMIEVHNDPIRALCDGAQSLNPEQFAETMRRVQKIRDVVTEI